MLPLALLLLIAARWPEATSLPNVDEFHAQMLRRFSDGRGFGMSRIVMWPTLGHHFRSPVGARVDFKPENPAESEIIERWSTEGWQAGLYVFGAKVETEPVSSLLHRALKGPGVLNENTPRTDLPKWSDVYPIAAEAMLRFHNGANSHTANLNGWAIQARPVKASKEACVQCHDTESTIVKVGDVLGGVMYVSRR